MKKILFILCLTLISCGGIPVKDTYKKLKTDKVDEYTGVHIKTTYWRTMNVNSFKFRTRLRFKNRNGVTYLQLEIFNFNGVFAIEDGENIYLKSKNGEVLKIYNPEYQISHFNGSSQFPLMVLSCPMSSSELEKLKNMNFEGIRIYTTEGYIEDDISEKQSSRVNKLANLIIKKTNDKTTAQNSAYKK